MGFKFPPSSTRRCNGRLLGVVGVQGDAITLQSSGKLFSLAEVCATLGCTLGSDHVSVQ